jgi:carboxylesterase type B
MASRTVGLETCVRIIHPSYLHPSTDISSVEWTRDNITAFGGDPSRITLWGQSSGAASVDIYSYAYPNDPIVSGLICDPGSATILASTDHKHSNFTFLADLMGCTNPDDADAELACMREVPADKLRDTLPTYYNRGDIPDNTFVPIADEKVVFRNTTDRAMKGFVANIVSFASYYSF